MSNLSQFYGKTYPIGATLSIHYQGNTIVTADDTEWFCPSPLAILPYTSAYASVSDTFKTPHAMLPGMYGTNKLMPCGNFASLAYDRINNIWVTGGAALNWEGDAVNGYNYFRSTDGGTNWTKHTFPNTKPYFVQYIESCSRWIGYSPSSTTNGAIWSTDGITWNTVAAISLFNVSEILDGGGNQILTFAPSSTAGAYSTDGGATWASTTFSSTVGITVRGCVGTWNSGAGLYILPTNTAGVYMTSPTGQTWTTRTVPTFSQYVNQLAGNQFRFASNSTTTLVVGCSGFFCISTDGLTWSNHGFIAPDIYMAIPPSMVMWNGTYFVVAFRDRIFYSSNGTSWTEGKRFLPGGNSNTDIISGRRMIRFCTSSSTVLGKTMILSDPTLTTPAYVALPTTQGSISPSMSYIRIR